MTQWVRVHLPGVGKWTQNAEVALQEGAKVIDEPAVDASGHPLVDEPDEPGKKSSPKTRPEA